MNLKLSQTFTALKHRNFRLWFLGQMVSLIGTWMQSTAQGYLMYELTSSPIMLGITGFASGIPIWVFALYSGLVSDRFSRRKVILIAQSSMMILGFILAILTFTNTVQAWHIVVLALLLGVANAFDAPARQTFVVDMVPKEDLTNAIALNSSVFNLGTIIGPSVAGIVYALLGPGWCFTINGISFLGVITALLMMNVPFTKKAVVQKSQLSDLKEGVQFAIRNVDVRYLLINMSAMSIFAFSLLTLMPAWATTVLGGDVTTNGMLLSARGVGSLAAALLIANIGPRVVLGRLWTIGGILMPLSLVILGSFKVLPVSLVTLVVLGWALMAIVNITNALIQKHVPDELRGRVMSIYILVFQGSFPIGSLLVGFIAGLYGAPFTIIVSSIVTAFVFGIILFLRPSLKNFN